MATYYLDVDDEITSAAARIRSCPDPELALVLSQASRVATSRINFRLLAREAKRHERRLTIVSGEPEVRSLARSAGLPVFATVTEYDSAEAARQKMGDAGADAITDALGQLAATMDGKSGRDKPIAGAGPAGGGRGMSNGGNGSGARVVGLAGQPVRGRTPVFMVISLVLIALIALGGVTAGFLFLPSTTITLTVVNGSVGPLDLTLRVDPGATRADYDAGILPGLTKSFDLSQTQTFTATGEKSVDTKATGTVTFYSENTIENVPIPAGTEVWTSGGVYFQTTERVDVPMGVFATSTPGRATAHVQAINGGTSGNVSAGAITNLPAGFAPFLITVSNARATAGGTHTILPVVTDADIQNAQDTLLEKLGEQLGAQLQSPQGIPAGVQLFGETGQVDASSIVYSPSDLSGKQVDSFDLTASGLGSATMVELSYVQAAGLHKIAPLVSSGYSLLTDSVTVKVGGITADGEVASVSAIASGLQSPKLSADALRKAVKGKSIDAARKYLSQYGQVKIENWPGLWGSNVAGYDFRIDIRLIEPAPVATPTSSSSAQPSGEPTAAPTASPTAAPSDSTGGGG